MLKNFEEALKESGKLPFLFVGSGISRRYLGLPNWDGLLENFSIKSYSFYKSGNDSNYPKIGSHIAEDYHKDWFDKNPNTDQKFSLKTDPLKYEIAQYLNKKFDYNGLSEIEQREIDKLKTSKISGIITTNYDTLLEELFSDKGFHKYIGQDNLLFNKTYDYGEIYKIHGCIDDYKSIVITEEDYNNFKDKQQYLISKLLSIFLEYPIIFLGYSFSDENIEDIFTNILKTIGSENIEKLQNRIFFVEWKESYAETSLKETIKSLNNINLPIIKIEVNNFVEVFSALNKLNEKHSPKFVRHLKDKIYELVKTETATNKILVKDKDLSNLDSLDDLEIVIGFGVIGEVGSRGLTSYNIEDIIKDVLNIELIPNADGLIDTTFTNLRGTIPVYKYLKEKNINQNNYKNSNLHKNIINFIEKDISYYTKGLSSFFNKLEKNDIVDHLRTNSFHKIDTEKFKKFLVENIDLLTTDDNKKSNFRKLVCLYDRLEYGWTNKTSSSNYEDTK